MEPINNGFELRSRIRNATVEFLDTGEQYKLGSKQKSYCLFLLEFEFDEFIVQLRLDFKDIDSNQNPKLDADFKDINNPDGHLDLVGELEDAHHTESECKEERRYTWLFRDFKRSFRVTIDWLMSADIKGGSTVSATMTKTKSEQ